LEVARQAENSNLDHCSSGLPDLGRLAGSRTLGLKAKPEKDTVMAEWFCNDKWPDENDVTRPEAMRRPVENGLKAKGRSAQYNQTSALASSRA